MTGKEVNEMQQVLKDMKSFYNAEINALVVENNDLNKKISSQNGADNKESLQIRESQVFTTWPGWQPVRTMQYPS